MTNDKLRSILEIGETIAVEFKLCSSGIGDETYKTVCSFLNRFGGDIFLGVDDHGKVIGIPKNATGDMIKNFIKTISNPEMLNPTVYLNPQLIQYQRKNIIHIHIHPSSEVHKYKNVVYDRVDDADVKVTSTSQLSMMYIRKQEIFTEKKIFKYITDADLRLDMLPQLVQRAINHHAGSHPWVKLSTKQILKSARLIAKDAESGIVGYNRAAVMLLGRDEVIKDICPNHRTDALLRKVNVDRYDDRLLVETNLIDSFDLLMGFAEKHLWDKFYLENENRVSLRNAIAREILVNSLMHREFTSAHIARFVIERDRMYTENANRASSYGSITPENLEPNPKNPIISGFFRNIGLADELGSGVINLFKYGRRYSGKDPELVDGDVFRIIVPLDEDYSFDAETDEEPIIINSSKKERGLNETQQKILALMAENPNVTTGLIAGKIGISRRQVTSYILELRSNGFIEREGTKKEGHWIVKKETLG